MLELFLSTMRDSTFRRRRSRRRLLAIERCGPAREPLFWRRAFLQECLEFLQRNEPVDLVAIKENFPVTVGDEELRNALPEQLADQMEFLPAFRCHRTPG